MPNLNYIAGMNMIEHNIENLSTPKAIAEFARAEGLINMAENYTDQPCKSELEQILQQKIIPYVNESSEKFGLFSLREAISKKTQHFVITSYSIHYTKLYDSLKVTSSP